MNRNHRPRALSRLRGLTRLRALSRRDLLDLLLLTVFLSWARVRLTVLPARLNQRYLRPSRDSTDRETTNRVVTPLQKERAERLVFLVEIAARVHPLRDLTCLRRTLALRARLRMLGIPSTLEYGIRRSGDRYAPHAWLAILYGTRRLTLDSYRSSHRYNTFRAG